MSNLPQSFNVQNSRQHGSQKDDAQTVRSADPNTNYSCDSKTDSNQLGCFSAHQFRKSKVNQNKYFLSIFECQKDDNFLKNQYKQIKKNNFFNKDNSTRFKIISNDIKFSLQDKKIFKETNDLKSKKIQKYSTMQLKINKSQSNQSDSSSNILETNQYNLFDQKSSCKTTVSKMIDSTPLQQKNLLCESEHKKHQQLYQSYETCQQFIHHIQQVRNLEQEQQTQQNQCQGNQDVFFSLQNNCCEKMEIDDCKSQQKQAKNADISLENTILMQKQQQIKRLSLALRESIDQNQILKDRIVVLQSIMAQLTSGGLYQIKNDNQQSKKAMIIQQRRLNDRTTRKYSM